MKGDRNIRPKRMLMIIRLPLTFRGILSRRADRCPYRWWFPRGCSLSSDFTRVTANFSLWGDFFTGEERVGWQSDIIRRVCGTCHVLVLVLRCRSCWLIEAYTLCAHVCFSAWNGCKALTLVIISCTGRDFFQWRMCFFSIFTLC